jgi:hypothetical protein
MSDCERCGYPEDSFACKIRHVAVDVSALKAAREQGR